MKLIPASQESANAFCVARDCEVYIKGCCPAHKPIIPANAQSFVRENGQIKVWAVVEDGTCFTCAFGRGWDCTERPCKLLNTDDKHYRIVAVEMVEGE
jgi:hypothetical protein